MVEGRVENGKLTIFLEGKIDSLNAPAVEKSIQEQVREHPCETVELDCDRLEYCTSAGLRVILRLSQEVEDTKLINVHSDLYNILEMTGFT